MHGIAGSGKPGAPVRTCRQFDSSQGLVWNVGRCASVYGWSGRSLTGTSLGRSGTTSFAFENAVEAATSTNRVAAGVFAGGAAVHTSLLPGWRLSQAGTAFSESRNTF